MIVLDASVWVALLWEDDRHHKASDAWFARIERSRQPVAGPHLLLAEVAGAVARRAGKSELGLVAMRYLTHLTTLHLVSVDRGLSVRAARLAAELRLRGADAVYVATAQALGVPLITWDRELAERAAPAVEVCEPGATDSGTD